MVIIRILLLFLGLTLSLQAGPPPGYRLVFSDEFDGPLSIPGWTGWTANPPTKWICHTPYNGDFGQAWFSGPSEANTADPFSIADGKLTITASWDPLRNHWRSGLLSSMNASAIGFSQALGYWECRMLLPPGAGVWPAFWLDGVTGINKQRTKNTVEIDVLEAYGIDMTIAHQYVHVWTVQGADICQANHSQTLLNQTWNYHVYGCLVKRDFITFYIDGAQIWSTPTPPEALEPLYVMVDLALGGGGGKFPITQTPNPSHLIVDYVRAYAPPM
jgi:beta-glucanase (GH16 family)